MSVILNFELLILNALIQNSPFKIFDTAKIQTEVQALISKIRDEALHADSTSLYELFALNDPDFAYMQITGVYYDATAFKKMVYDFYGAIKTEILKKGAEKLFI